MANKLIFLLNVESKEKERCHKAQKFYKMISIIISNLSFVDSLPVMHKLRRELFFSISIATSTHFLRRKIAANDLCKL